jgi:hypothetical protein
MAAKRTSKGDAEPKGGYRKTRLSRLIEDSPDHARAEILAAYRLKGANLKASAAVLDCTYSTLIRWVKRLELGPALEKLSKVGADEGWIDRKAARARGATVSA